MDLNYKKKLQEFEIEDLSDDNLDPAFVAKAKEFEKKLESGSLTDEEITQWDKELCEIFDENHDFESVDSEEVIQLRRQNMILEAKKNIDETNDIKILQDLSSQHKELSEVVDYAEKKINAIKAQMNKEQKAKQERDELLQQITDTEKISDLNTIANEHANDKEIVDACRARANEIKESDQAKKEGNKNEIAEKLLSRESWSYSELREMGIQPTGDDMKLDGVLLERIYMFKAYRAKKI